MFEASTHACSPHPRVQPAPTLVATTHACSQHPTRAAAISPANAHLYHRDALHFFSPLTLCPYSQLNVLKFLHLLPTHCFLTLSEFSVFSRSKLSFSALLISFFSGFRALGVHPHVPNQGSRCRRSFSAVQKPIFESTSSYCSMFQYLQDFHIFAQLQI